MHAGGLARLAAPGAAPSPRAGHPPALRARDLRRFPVADAGRARRRALRGEVADQHGHRPDGAPAAGRLSAGPAAPGAWRGRSGKSGSIVPIPSSYRWVRDPPRWHPDLVAASERRNLLGALAAGGPFAKLLQRVDAQSSEYVIDLQHLANYDVHEGLCRLGSRTRFTAPDGRLAVTGVEFERRDDHARQPEMELRRAHRAGRVDDPRHGVAAGHGVSRRRAGARAGADPQPPAAGAPRCAGCSRRTSTRR